MAATAAAMAATTAREGGRRSTVGGEGRWTSCDLPPPSLPPSFHGCHGCVFFFFSENRPQNDVVLGATGGATGKGLPRIRIRNKDGVASVAAKLTTPMNFSTYMGEHYKMIAEPGMPDADMDNKMMESSVGREICVSEGAEMFNLYDERDLIVHEIDGNVEPCIGMEFESEEAAMACYDAYAKRVGFVIRVGNCHRSSRDGSVISRRFLCNKEGFRVNNKKVKRLEVRKAREITREGCKAMIMVRKEKSGKWIVAKLETEHSHPLGIPAGKGRRGTIQARPQDEKDKKIRELSTQLQRANQQLAECQKQLDMVLKDIEQHTSHLTKSIQEIVANVKEVEDEEEDQL